MKVEYFLVNGDDIFDFGLLGIDGSPLKIKNKMEAPRLKRIRGVALQVPVASHHQQALPNV